METGAASKDVTIVGTSTESEDNQLQNVVTQSYQTEQGNVLLVQEQMVLDLQNMVINPESAPKLIEGESSIKHGIATMGLENLVTEPTNVVTETNTINTITETTNVVTHTKDIFTERRNSMMETDNIMMEIEKIITDPENIIMDALTDSENLLMETKNLMETAKIIDRSDVPVQEKTTPTQKSTSVVQTEEKLVTEPQSTISSNVTDDVDNVTTQKENPATEEAYSGAELENIESDEAENVMLITVEKGHAKMTTSEDEQISTDRDTATISRDVTTISKTFITSERDGIISEQDKLTEELESLIPLPETAILLQNVFEQTNKNIDEKRETERETQDLTELEYALIDEPSTAVQNVQETLMETVNSTIQYPTCGATTGEEEKFRTLKTPDPILEYERMLNEEESTTLKRNENVYTDNESVANDTTQKDIIEEQSSTIQFDDISMERDAIVTECEDKTIEQESQDPTLEWETILKEQGSSKQKSDDTVPSGKEDVTNIMRSQSSTIQLDDILLEQESATTVVEEKKKCQTVEELDPILELEGLLKDQEKSKLKQNEPVDKDSLTIQCDTSTEQECLITEENKSTPTEKDEVTNITHQETENENPEVPKRKESSEKEEESIGVEQSDVSIEEEKIVEHDDDQEIEIAEKENAMIQLEDSSDSDVEPARKKPKHSNSSQTLLDVLECEDPDNFPYDFPTNEKISEAATSTNKNNRKSTDKPVFMHIDTERDQDKMTSATEQDEVAEDPIGESTTDWTQDDTECIVPDTNQAQEERHCSLNGRNSDSGPSTTAVENPEWEGKYVVNISNGEESKLCMLCSKEDIPKYTCTLNKNQTFICSEPCLKQLKEQNVKNIIVRDLRVKNFSPPPEANAREAENFRHCADCGLLLTDPDVYLSWECLEFCEVKCIQNYQKKIGSYCSTCEMEVMEIHLGKYCVRFGFDIRQFCSGTCLIKYKKGLKVCSYCRENVQHPTENTTGDVKVKTRDFCSESCRESYMTLKEGKKVVGACAVCHKEKPVEIEFFDALKEAIFCSEPCFVAFKYVNNVVPEKCGMCAKYYRKKELSLYMINAVGVVLRFCSKTCQNVYININRKIVACCWCKVKKYNFDMIQRFEGTQCLMWCSLNCQRLYESSYSPTIGKRRCAVCYKHGNMIYHITSDLGLKSFCSYKCVRDHQTKQIPALRVSEISNIPTIIKRVTRKAIGPARKQIIPDAPAPLPIITSVRSLAPTTERIHRTRSSSPEIEKPLKYVIMVRPADLPDIRNVQTTAKPLAVNMETLSKPVMVDQETQTDIFNPTDMEVVPVPIYIPQPIHMFNFTYIKALPFAIPIPVPILIAMTKTGTSGILKEVKTAQPTPSDPYEADLLVMAQLVADANDKEVEDEQAVESEPDDTATDDPAYSPEPQEQNTSFGDDVLQMALHMATDFTEPAVDLEGALTANTITATSCKPNGQVPLSENFFKKTSDQIEEMTPSRPERASRGARKRGRSSRGGKSRGKARPTVQQPMPVPEPTPEPPPEPAEKPDANMCLKYTFGVNAWKQWVTNKNNELEKSSRRVKLFKPDLLQLTSDELNYSLCLFIKEVRKPNGAEYAPDTIYYLCLGVQQYLFENGRIDNIFCDPYYETFTDSLDDICKKFSTLYNDSQYIVTRVEEEHLWESKQLGAHSPHVLLSTLMFFNTKHFNLTNVEEHMQLSFSHIMKHWKRVPNTPGTSKNTTSRNILLRFYPPQSSADGSRKKKVYEQQENEENPIRCPVKLYEFYLSKCPESVKTRNDVFYLQPERSCVPDSPVWYSTMALGKESLEKMLHRVKMVKEINVALLSS